ncbi:ABC transporter substrate-binding protein [Actinoalloteichus sp. AHMU CJ021]|uniref:ABC transporter substrate-binding protein n=1 Tax=Actinoalloteichus sp. AHMU CJ021 TaxID=2072503 RepID=UPI0026C17B4C
MPTTRTAPPFAPHRIRPRTAWGQLSRRGFLGGVGAAGLVWGVSACGASSSPAEGDDGAGGTRRVDHPLGSTDIPLSPQRVITLDTVTALQVALEHDAPLVASATLDGDVAVPEYLPGGDRDFEHLGFNQVNLEVISQLRPDLVIGNIASLEEHYATLSELTAVVAYENSRDGVEWRRSCRAVADLLGHAEAQEERVREYEDRAARVALDHADVLGTTRIALLRFTTDELRIVTDSVIFSSQVLTDCGVRRTESSTGAEGETYTSVSLEQVSRLDDADAIIYFGGGGAFEGGQVSTTFTTYTESTLWERLPAVRAGNVFEVPRTTWWDGASTSAAHRVIDDLVDVLERLA